MAFKYNGTNVQQVQFGGQVKYTIYGDPIIQDGILIGPSANNYISTSESFNPVNNSFNIKIKYKVLADGNLTYFIGNTNGFKFYVTGTNANNLGGIIKGSSDNYWTSLNVPTFSHITDTWYTLEFNYNGTNTYTVTISSNGTTIGTSSTTSNIKIASGNIGIGYNGGSAAYEVDLNNTIVKINNKIWYWQPMKTNYVQTGSQVNSKLVYANPDLYLEGPVTYTKVGNPTVIDNVVSGFSSSDYLSLPATLDISKNFEWVFCITTDDLQAEQRIFAYNTGTINSVYIQNKYLKWWITGDVSNILSTDALNPNTRYFIKCSNVNGLYSLSYSTDGITYTGLRTKELSLSTSISSYYDIGVNHTSYYSPFSGSIDINNTYIKVNGNLWFYGRNYATQNIAPVPANYSYGTTTTTGIGFVDMRTQQYTELPEGVTLINDSLGFRFPYNLPIQF